MYLLDVLEFCSQKWKKSFTPDVFKDRIVCKTPEDMEDLKADQILALFNSDGTAVASKDGLPNVPAVSGSNVDMGVSHTYLHVSRCITV